MKLTIEVILVIQREVCLNADHLDLRSDHSSFDQYSRLQTMTGRKKLWGEVTSLYYSLLLYKETILSKSSLKRN